MAVDKFKFVSPGVFINEIDESALPPQPVEMGPVVIGRFAKGPAMRPVQVESFPEFVSLFGNPSDGNPGGDVWRTGAMTAPTYAAYAVQAWLRNNSPVTVFRLLGEQSDSAEAYSSTNLKGQAGWRTANTLNNSINDSGGAYGLFVMPDPDKRGSTTTVDIVAANVSLSGGETLTFTDQSGNVYSAQIDGDVAIADSTATKIGASGISGDTANLCDSIQNSLNQARLYGVTATTKDTADGSALLDIQAAGEGGTTSTIRFVANGVPQDPVRGTLVSGDKVTVANDSHVINTMHVTGTLAAIWYVEDGAVVLSGTARDSQPREGAGVLIRSTDQKFTAKVVKDGYTTAAANTGVQKSATFNFDKDSDLYIRKVFNTDPTKTNEDLVCTDCGGTQEHYWLGETFDQPVRTQLAVTGTAVNHSGEFLGVILGLKQGSTDWSNHLGSTGTAAAAKTGWFISQDTRGTNYADFNPIDDTEKLFRLVALDNGAHTNRDIKISIQDIKAPSDKFNKFGTFSVLVRRANDTDNNPVVLERYSGLNLNPTSANFIARVIGNREYTYDATNKVIRQHGDYPNHSQHIRVETSPLVDNAGAEGLLPYGCFGPVVPRNLWIAEDSTIANVKDQEGTTNLNSWVLGGQGVAGHLPTGSLVNNTAHSPASILFNGDAAEAAYQFNLDARLDWPRTRTRVSSSEGDLVLDTQAYFGYQSVIEGTRIFDHTNLDLLRAGPAGLDQHAVSSNNTEYSWVFTLDDVRLRDSDGDNTDTSTAIWTSGSRADNLSLTARSGSEGVLDKGFNRFTSPMWGGRDGLKIQEADPFRNNYLDGGGVTTNYAYYSVKKAIDILSDSEYVEFDTACMPGLTNTNLTTALVNACEDRGDSLAIIDLPGGYVPKHETNTTETARVGSVDTTVSNLKAMGLNSSYGCAFYPWVQVRDTINNSILYVPPSVVALGTFSSSQRKSDVWFAPAGFTRGGLSEGSAGIPVVGVRQRVTSKERDKLYDANINPIASFPAEGIVIFGQKTLQVTPSALDRINVRRLLIFLKKRISKIASRILFDQNVQKTWDRFIGQVDPLLDSVKAGFGLTDYKVVLDGTTTTPDLIDRNIMYAKIYLKPARAIEYIALDFIITRSGASFDD
tara:strand:+ start:2428 stop:5811 length:3384 start_codon:yes stop_codon:yes gene_type:complete